MKYTEKHIPEGMTVSVKHIRNEQVRWNTVAVLIDQEGRVVGTGIARCAPRDNPCRKIGRAIAVGRALKNFHEDGNYLS